MEKIKVELELTPEQNARLADFLLLFEHDAAPAGQQEDDPAPVPEPSEEAPATPEPPAPLPEPKVPYERLREACAQKCTAGHGEAVRALLNKFGEGKLSTVPPEHYDALFAEVEALK